MPFDVARNVIEDCMGLFIGLVDDRAETADAMEASVAAVEVVAVDLPPALVIELDRHYHSILKFKPVALEK